MMVGWRAEEYQGAILNNNIASILQAPRNEVTNTDYSESSTTSFAVKMALTLSPSQNFEHYFPPEIGASGEYLMD